MTVHLQKALDQGESGLFLELQDGPISLSSKSPSLGTRLRLYPVESPRQQRRRATLALLRERAAAKPMRKEPGPALKAFLLRKHGCENLLREESQGAPGRKRGTDANQRSSSAMDTSVASAGLRSLDVVTSFSQNGFTNALHHAQQAVQGSKDIANVLRSLRSPLVRTVVAYVDEIDDGAKAALAKWHTGRGRHRLEAIALLERYPWLAVKDSSVHRFERGVGAKAGTIVQSSRLWRKVAAIADAVR